MNSEKLCAVVVSLCVLWGCGEVHGGTDDGGGSDSGVGLDAGPRDASGPGIPPPTRDVDLLFVIDNSGSMLEEQAALATEVPRMIQILTTGDFDQDGSTDGPDDFTPVEELRVAVVTTDMGTGGVMVPTCSMPEGGEDGLFRTSSAGAGCRASYPSFLTFNSAGAGSSEAFAESVACVLQAGTTGCGFEQPLEAGLKALSPGAPTSWTAADFSAPEFLGGGSGHGDGAHRDFLRDDSILGVIVLSDEADCSVSDPALFDAGSTTYAGPLGVRCFEYEDEALYPVSRYIDGLLQLRRYPSRLVFAPIVGVPVDLAPTSGTAADWDSILSDDRMQQTVDPMTGGSSILPSCEVSGVGRAFPPRRMVRVAQELEARGASTTVGSICQSSYAGVLNGIIRQLAR